MLANNLKLTDCTILVTGAAGFIGSNLVKRLFRDFCNVRIVGVDSVTDYYDVNLKYARLKEIDEIVSAFVSTEAENQHISSWKFIKGNIADRALVNSIFQEEKPHVVVNLAAQAGVRYSIENPDSYIESNIIGFYNILEACRHSYDAICQQPTANDTQVRADDKSHLDYAERQKRQRPTETNCQQPYTGVQHLVYASSSSVYGNNEKVPYSTDDKVDNPISLYAATKKCNELMAHCYSKLYNIPSTGLRFFTVYGPAGRPDMAYFGFTNKLLKGEKIQIFNYGNCRRDFTYIDDIVEGIIRVMQHAPEKSLGEDGLPIPPYIVYNIGNNHPENLLDFVQILQEELVLSGVLSADYDFDSHKELVPMQSGDVPITFADTFPLERDFGFKPSTTLRDGIKSFAKWYADAYMNR